MEYLEEFLIAAVNDNFDVHFDDGSSAEVAAKIVGMRKMTLRGDFVMVDDMYTKWQERQARGGQNRIFAKQIEQEDNTTDWDSENTSDEDDDVTMNDVPALARTPKEKPVPKVDEDGFTEVIGKKKR